MLTPWAPSNRSTISSPATCSKPVSPIFKPSNWNIRPCSMTYPLPTARRYRIWSNVTIAQLLICNWRIELTLMLSIHPTVNYCPIFRPRIGPNCMQSNSSTQCWSRRSRIRIASIWTKALRISKRATLPTFRIWIGPNANIVTSWVLLAKHSENRTIGWRMISANVMKAIVMTSKHGCVPMQTSVVI